MKPIALQSAIVLCAAAAILAPDVRADTDSVAERWVATWGDKWWERYHADYVGLYPGGRTDRFHDIYLGEALARMADTGIADYSITNKQYLYDGNWFVVEWLYTSTQKTTGKVQREATVAFGFVEDDHLRIWIEYFDDMVGAYQWLDAMPLYAEDETPYPWPAGATLNRPYRP